jgi:23S rRNA C2498 (ribose-2'-O)-methylase RlmM
MSIIGADVPKQRSSSTMWCVDLAAAMPANAQRITTTRHVRLTAVDGHLFAALIESPHLDWRRDQDACRYRTAPRRWRRAPWR